VSAYWAGAAWPESERLAVLHLDVMIDDMMTAPAEDFRGMMEMRNGKHERNTAD
jgi:5'(3')-deoxyribonucleotidase